MGDVQEGVPGEFAGPLGEVDGLPGWSDWPQRRVAESTTDPDVLRVVSREGRTRRIRQAAVDALRRGRGVLRARQVIA
ncbi:hypothetical protein ACE1SV_04380 [Streptomyces sennicomposti]